MNQPAEQVALPEPVDLVVLDHAPLWLAGRVALTGDLLFDDDPRERVAWQADTRLRWLDERPLLLERQAQWRQAVGRRRAGAGASGSAGPQSGRDQHA